jgi:hypothetical protein
MSNLAEYFAANRYHGKWEMGDRVFGYYKKIPFIGTVGNDTLISDLIGPQVSIFLDLPIKIDNIYKSVIIVKPKDIKHLEVIDDVIETKPKRKNEFKHNK